MSKCAFCQQEVLTKILSGKIIALDVGHGWSQAARFDVGAVGNNTTEHDLNRRVAFHVEKLLETLGATVHVFDYFSDDSPRLWLSEKGKRAASVKADVFVSIHHNAFDGSAQGTETLIHSKGTNEDLALAKSIQKRLVENLKLTDRGIKWKQLGVLGGCPASIPACLTEAFFIDSVRFKGSIPESVLEAEALGIALGIKDFLVSE